MRRTAIGIGGLALASAYFVLSALPAIGASVLPPPGADTSTGSVSAKVTVAAPCLTVNPDSISFGSLGFSADDLNQTAGNATPFIHTVTSCAPSDQKLFVKGSDAFNESGTVKWTLRPANTCIGTPNTNFYGLRASENGALSGVYRDLQTTNLLVRAMTASEAIPMRALLWMPCAGSNGAGETMSMQIVYTATF